MVDSCAAECSHCGSSEPTAMCSACHCALYCGRACQRRDWQRHRDTCEGLAYTAFRGQSLSSIGSLGCSPCTMQARERLVCCLHSPWDPRAIAQARYSLATTLFEPSKDRAGVRAECNYLYRASLATARELDGCNGDLALRVSSNMAVNHILSGKLEQAAELLQDILTRSKAVSGNTASSTLRHFDPLYTCLCSLGRLQEARALVHSVLQSLGIAHAPDKGLEELADLARRAIGVPSI